MTVMVGGGVRGRIDTLKIRVRGGPSDQEFFRIVRAKGYRASYTFTADSGFQNLSVMVGYGLVRSHGEVVVGDAQLMIVSADRVVELRPENRKLFQLLRAQLTAKDHVLAHKRVGCELDRLIQLYGPRRADSLIREAEFLAIDPIRDEAALRRVDNALAGHVFSAGCDTTGSER
jgi:hypothetical protein